MDMKNEKLQEYAKLLIEVGLHVQKGRLTMWAAVRW